MPTFAHGDPAFDAIEYEIETKEHGFMGTIRTESRIVIKDCTGADHPTPRVFRSRDEATIHVEPELIFMVEYWRQQLDDRHRAVVCDGTHYRIGKPDAGPAAHRGFGGSQWTFKSLKTDEVITSTNVWYQGVVPAFARKAFPDTHTRP